MNRPFIALASLLMLAACRVPPITQADTVTLPTIVVKEKTDKPEAPVKVPAIKPPPQNPVKSNVDALCPPAEKEIKQERIIRELDCLLEHD